MKKTFTLFTAMILSVVLYAYPNQSRLSISTMANTNMQVMVDGNKYRGNANGVMISNLNEGYHAIKVFQIKNERGGNPLIGFQNSKYQLIYSSNIYIKSHYHVDIFINRFGKAFMDEQFISGRYQDENDDDWSDNNYEPGNYDNNMMNRSSFEQFKSTLKNESFDNTRLSIAKQVIAANHFSSAQVKELVDLFGFDNSRLEVARFAYKYTVDKWNYFVVNDAFSFSSSKDELMKYMQTNN